MYQPECSTIHNGKWIWLTWPKWGEQMGLQTRFRGWAGADGTWAARSRPQGWQGDAAPLCLQDPGATRPPSGRASASVAAAATANKMGISLCLLLCITFRHTALTECSSCAGRLLARALRKARSSPAGSGSGVDSVLPIRGVCCVEQGSDILYWEETCSLSLLPRSKCFPFWGLLLSF